MTARAALFALVAVTCAGSVARADDKAKKYEVRVKAVWKAGDTFTTTTTDLSEHSLQLVMGGVTQKIGGETKSAVRYTAVERVDAVNAEGRPTKRTIAFTKWSLGGDDSTPGDSTIEGYQITVTGLGTERDWEFLGDAPVASQPAMDWLNLHYGHENEETPIRDPYAIFVTKAPVPVGGTWEIDASELS